MKGLHKINARWKELALKCLIMIPIMVVILEGYKSDVRANTFYTTPIVTYDNYNVTYNFKNEGVLTGEGTITFQADLSDMATYSYTWCKYIPLCSNCNYHWYNYTSMLKITINNFVILTDNDHEYLDPSDRSKWKTVSRDFDIPGKENATVEIYYKAPAMTCKSCGHQENMILYFDGITFSGKRGHATFQNSSIEVTQGGQITLNPAYDENAYRTEWGIRYLGESGFSPLSNGTNSNGMVVSGANEKNITVSNIPYVSGGFDLGVFVYTASGKLPGGYDYPDTPYFTHVTCKDITPPAVTISKNVNPNGGAVSVTINASDEGGLADKPYSFDGGKTFVSENTKSFDKVGTYQVQVKDKSGNIAKETFCIDSTEIKSGGSPSAGSGGSGVSEKESGTKTGSGGSSGGTSGGTSGGASGSGSTGGSANGGNGAGKTGSGSLDPSKNGNDDYVTGGSASGSSSGSANGSKSASGKDVKEVEGAKSSNGGSTSGKAAGKGDLSPSEIDENDSEDAFERIKENSEDYIISMQENPTSENAAESDESSIDMKSVDATDGDGANNYTDSGNMGADYYVPDKLKDSNVSIVIIAVLSLLLLLILAFFLFFGVIIFAEKETELSALSGTAGVKVPVAISIVTYKDKKFSICFRSLFDKHDVLYARLGWLFVYMYEGEKIGIQTKYKNDKKREIATETVRKEIKAGQKKKKKDRK